jgi:hypothetical protein
VNVAEAADLANGGFGRGAMARIGLGRGLSSAQPPRTQASAAKENANLPRTTGNPPTQWGNAPV